jgi:hypothetical protein
MDSTLPANLDLPLIVRNSNSKRIIPTEMVDRLVVLFTHVLESEAAFGNEDIQFKSFQPVWSRVVQHPLVRKHFADDAQQFGLADTALSDPGKSEAFAELAPRFLKVVPKQVAWRYSWRCGLVLESHFVNIGAAHDLLETLDQRLEFSPRTAFAFDLGNPYVAKLVVSVGTFASECVDSAQSGYRTPEPVIVGNSLPLRRTKVAEAFPKSDAEFAFARSLSDFAFVEDAKPATKVKQKDLPNTRAEQHALADRASRPLVDEEVQKIEMSQASSQFQTTRAARCCGVGTHFDSTASAH